MSRAVHKRIAAGNSLRDEKRWAAAAGAYEAALHLDPSLHHIWIQFGNMCREAGASANALRAYNRASILRPDDPEPLARSAEVFAERRDLQSAARYFWNAARVKILDRTAFLRLATLFSEQPRSVREKIRTSLRGSGGGAGGTVRDAGTSYLDVSAVVEGWAGGVQTLGLVGDMFRHALANDTPIRLCCITPDRAEWVVVDRDVFTGLIASATTINSEASKDFAVQIARFTLSLLIANSASFVPGARVYTVVSTSPNIDHALALRSLWHNHQIDLVDLAGMPLSPQSIGNAALREEILESAIWHPVKRDHFNRPTDTFDFRIGEGWFLPDKDGSWTRVDGGELAFCLPDHERSMRVYLKLNGLPGRDCRYFLRVEHLAPRRGVISAGSSKLIVIDLPQMKRCRIFLRGEDLEQLSFGDRRVHSASLGVAGLYLIPLEDFAARWQFIENLKHGQVFIDR